MELQIIRAREFVRLGAEDHFDLPASKLALAKLAAACCKRGINQALLDLRAFNPGPKPVFTPQNLNTLVSTFREMGFTHQQRLAVLYASDPHHRARLFSFIATVRGWKVRAFGDFEQAILWLSESETESFGTPKSKAPLSRQIKSVKIPTRMHPVPVKFVKAKTNAAAVAKAASLNLPPVVRSERRLGRP